MAYSPASVTTGTSSLGHLATVHYDTTAVENLKASRPFMQATTLRTLPTRAGKTIQLFGYNTLSANTTPGTEGTVGTGIAPTTVNTQISLNQYFDFMSFSDLVVETAIDDIVENSAGEMGYRAGLTVNSLTISAFEAGVTGANSIDLADNEFFSAAIARQAQMSLRGQNVTMGPRGSSNLLCIIHALNVFDLVNDNTAGSFQDLAKYTESGVSQLRGIQSAKTFTWGGVDYMETTTVPTYTNYPSTGKTGFASYVVGKDAVFAVSLGNTGIPDEKNFALSVKTYNDVDRTDAAGVIRATVGYNFKFAVGARPSNTVPTYRRIRSESSIS